MTPDQLEQRLREKLPTATPRPGFETRLQALAREPRQPAGKRWLSHLVLPALVLPALALLVVISAIAPKKDHPTAAPDIATTPQSPAPVVKIEEPVTREYEGLKNDARWTMSLVRSTFPSIPAKPVKGSK